ncbi:transcriptional regulator, partial [Anaeromassilibacillus sp. An200]
DEGNPNPTALNEFIAEAKKLDSKAMSYILGIMKELNSKK